MSRVCLCVLVVCWGLSSVLMCSPHTHQVPYVLSAEVHNRSSGSLCASVREHVCICVLCFSIGWQMILGPDAASFSRLRNENIFLCRMRQQFP